MVEQVDLEVGISWTWCCTIVISYNLNVDDLLCGHVSYVSEFLAIYLRPRG